MTDREMKQGLAGLSLIVILVVIGFGLLVFRVSALRDVEPQSADDPIALSSPTSGQVSQVVHYVTPASGRQSSMNLMPSIIPSDDTSQQPNLCFFDAWENWMLPVDAAAFEHLKNGCSSSDLDWRSSAWLRGWCWHPANGRPSGFCPPANLRPPASAATMPAMRPMPTCKIVPPWTHGNPVRQCHCVDPNRPDHLYVHNAEDGRECPPAGGD